MKNKEKIIRLLEAIAEKLNVNLVETYSHPDPPGTPPPDPDED